jgi:FdhD protein
MPDNIQSVRIERITGNVRQVLDDPVTAEIALKIMLNDEALATLLCSPVNLNYMAAGYLFSEGLIKCREDIKKLTVDEQNSTVYLETRDTGSIAPEKSPGRGHASMASSQEYKINSQLKVRSDSIFKLVDEFQARSEQFKETGGVHGSALCNSEKILIMADDIGRHNTIDRIIGESILKDIPTDECMVITSGRISSEILLKVARKNIPFLISRSAPASLGVKLANDTGMTVIGFVRGQKMNIYSHGWRVITDAG